jgi:hypothetical protein
MDTFVLRIWTPATSLGEPAALPDGTHGTAHHVVSGRSGIFRSEEQLIKLIAQLRSEASTDGDAGGETAGGSGAV